MQRLTKEPHTAHHPSTYGGSVLWSQMQTPLHLESTGIQTPPAVPCTVQPAKPRALQKFPRFLERRQACVCITAQKGAHLTAPRCGRLPARLTTSASLGVPFHWGTSSVGCTPLLRPQTCAQPSLDPRSHIKKPCMMAHRLEHWKARGLSRRSTLSGNLHPWPCKGSCIHKPLG